MKELMNVKCTYVYHNEKGFLLLEHLLCLIIVSLISLVLLQLLQTSISLTPSPNTYSQADIEAVASQLQEDANYKVRIYATNDSRLLLDALNQDTISYRVYRNQLIRQRNGVGHEILLYNCQSLDVIETTDYSATIELKINDDIHRIHLSTHYFPMNQFLNEEEQVEN